ncbi:MAG TPA: DNA-formamidopyrimidine glycosylase, partial [Actinomycetota bacterium]|nr:DNA-formamidopyrimidine glycosylase [Actinomycetota bacterium]
ALLDSPRPLHGLLRDQRVIAGIGRSWVDEILHRTRLSPFARGEALTEEASLELRDSTIELLGGAIDHYADVLSIPIPDKMPMPLRIHRHEGEPCFRCGTRLEAVHFEDHTMTYCPGCQTGGKLLKDRRLSRLIK